MKSPNNEGNKASVGQLSSSNEVSQPKTGSHLVELLAKRIAWKFTKTTQIVSKPINALHNLQKGPIADDNTYIIH